MSSLRMLPVTLVLILGLALMSCAPPAPPPPAPAEEPEEPVEAVPDRPGGTITLYTSESEDKVNEMINDFNVLYPDVTVDIFRSGTGEVVAKIQAEMQAGEIQADVIWFADIDFFHRLADDGLLMSYVPEGGDRVSDEYHYRDNQFHEVRLIFNVVAYNTMLVDTPPTGWKDLLDPKYNGKVGMPSPFYSGAAFSHVGTFANLSDFGWEFYEALLENGAGVEQSNGAVANKLAAGEFEVVQLVDFFARNLKEEGSPVDHIWPEEGALLIPTPIGILNHTANADAATALLDYMYSDRGQELFVEQGYVAALPGMPVPQGAPDLEQLTVIHVDQDYISEHREEIRQRFGDLFGGA